MNSQQKSSFLIVVILNLVPLAGVWLFDWRTFDLVFLYWMENLVIGLFTVLRMLVRPYSHPIDAIFPLFLAPFFILHYGMFCYAHGSFVVSMFGRGDGFSAGLPGQVIGILNEQGMFLAFLSLVALQAVDWLLDIARHGLGADNARELMTAPYRRIVVLHLVIIGGGFALSTLGEPRVGLVALVVIKTASDLYHARREARQTDNEEPIELTEEQVAEMNQKFAEPVVKVNGTEKRFVSFADMRRSSEYRMMRSVMRLMGASNELRMIEAHLDRKIAEEQAAVEV